MKNKATEVIEERSVLVTHSVKVGDTFDLQTLTLPKIGSMFKVKEAADFAEVGVCEVTAVSAFRYTVTVRVVNNDTIS